MKRILASLLLILCVYSHQQCDNNLHCVTGCCRDNICLPTELCQIEESSSYCTDNSHCSSRCCHNYRCQSIDQCVELSGWVIALIVIAVFVIISIVVGCCCGWCVCLLSCFGDRNKIEINKRHLFNKKQDQFHNHHPSEDAHVPLIQQQPQTYQQNYGQAYAPPTQIYQAQQGYPPPQAYQAIHPPPQNYAAYPAPPQVQNPTFQQGYQPPRDIN